MPRSATMVAIVSFLGVALLVSLNFKVHEIRQTRSNDGATITHLCIGAHWVSAAAGFRVSSGNL